MKNSALTPELDDIILAEGQFYSMDCIRTQLNNNVLVVGATGSGKTRSIVRPNLLQAYGSYIISDPKGNLHQQYEEYLLARGYVVKKLDFVHPEDSAHYNFFNYIHSERDILKIAHMLMTSDGGLPDIDPFWDDAAELLLTSLIGYLYYTCPLDQDLHSIFRLIDLCEINENDPSAKNNLDRLMDDLAVEVNEDYFPCRQYRKFRAAAGRTLRSILIALNAKLGRYDCKEVNELMDIDDINIPLIGIRPTALFVVVSDTDRSMDNLANLFFTQAMNELCLYADESCRNSRLPQDVRFILDDFATNCRIDNFPRMISSIRSRGISTMLMIQAESQLTASYGEDGKTIISNCDTYVYLGGNDIATADSVSLRCDLPLQQILAMPVGTNWIFRRGQAPVNGKNFDLEPFEEEQLRIMKLVQSAMDNRPISPLI